MQRSITIRVLSIWVSSEFDQSLNIFQMKADYSKVKCSRTLLVLHFQIDISQASKIENGNDSVVTLSCTVMDRLFAFRGGPMIICVKLTD